MDGTQEYFTAWMKAQQDALAGMNEMTRKLQQSFSGFGGAAVPGFGGFQDAYSSWRKSVADALHAADRPDAGILRETLLKTLTGGNAYMKLYEMWLPLCRAIQDKSLSPEALRSLVDPTRYREMLDRVFGFDPAAASQLAEQAKQLVESATGSSQAFMKPWLDAAGKSLQEAPRLLEGHPESAMKIFHTMFSAFDGTVGRIFHVPAVGKDREKVELLLRSLDVLSVYLARNTEYEHTMYVTGLAAFEKVIAAVAEKVAKGEELKGFDQFFDLWVDVNEKAYSALFRTEDYARMQGDLLGASLDVRRNFFKLAELYLYDLPLALRSEMDDLYKTVHELKRKVKALERQVGGVKA